MKGRGRQATAASHKKERTIVSQKCCHLTFAILLVLSAIPSAKAWGPHSAITKAALKVLPEAERWKAALGAENLAAIATQYCWLPDLRSQDLRSFYADDYLLIQEIPKHVGHTMPHVHEAFAPYFRRALQALRTETPVNACRQLGPLVHFVEDVGAPPHAKENCPHHDQLETWVRAEQIVIDGYQPQLLGKNDEEALAGMMRRVDALVAFSTARAERALLLVSVAKPDRSKVEPILLESALECARAAADVLYTVLTLGSEPQPDGATLAGTVTAPQTAHDDHGARIVLLSTTYATLATTAVSQPAGASWQGAYSLTHLPPGSYRVLAYRTGSEPRISEPIMLETGKQTSLDFSLHVTHPAGNIVQNPDGKLTYLPGGAPDRWASTGTGAKHVWLSGAATVQPNTTYHCGAMLLDPTAQVAFRFQQAHEKNGKRGPDLVETMEFGRLSVNGPPESAERTVTLDGRRWRSVVVEVRSPHPLSRVLGQVWVAP
jgi:hypothetical protein